MELPQFVLDALAEAREEQQENPLKYGSEYQDNDLICSMPDGAPIPPDTLSKTFSLLKKSLLLKAASMICGTAMRVRRFRTARRSRPCSRAWAMRPPPSRSTCAAT